jgi:DNA (cytosine-5)-methyltransferase 1
VTTAVALLGDASTRASADSLSNVELFAGAGGLALGLSHAGFRPALLVDSNERACETLRANCPDAGEDWPVECAAVENLEYEKYDGIDLLSAGAPCQPFSVGGQLRGESDPRNMFPEVVRAVRELRPRAFVLENVRGLTFPRVREYFEYLLAELRTPSRRRKPEEDWKAHYASLVSSSEESHDYRVYWKVMNTADFGLAQNRPRLVVVGLHKDEPDFVWPQPTHNREALIQALYKDEYWTDHEVLGDIRDAVRETLPEEPEELVKGERWLTLRDVLKRLGPPGSRPEDPSHVLVPGARLYEKHTGSVLDWPAKTVKAGVHGCPGGEHIVIQDDGTHRYLTVRECAALQGFPDNYVLPSRRTHAMLQLGNAVPVVLAEAVGLALAEVLRHE